MTSISKSGAEPLSPYLDVDNRVDTTAQSSTSLDMLQRLRDIAWHRAVKYRWDPVVGAIHADYLEHLNKMIGEES